MKRQRRSPLHFTLLELVVAIAIIALTTALAVSAFRGESPARQMESAGLQFAAFCAKVRFQALENGADRMVVFYPETRTFKMAVPEEFQAKEEEAKEERLHKAYKDRKELWNPKGRMPERRLPEKRKKILSG